MFRSLQNTATVNLTSLQRLCSTMTYLCFVLSVVGLDSSEAFSQNHQFVHPGITWTQNDLDRLSALTTTSPWSAGWNQLISSTEGSLNYQMRGPFELVSNRPDINQSEHTSDSTAAMYHAIQWYVTGNVAHAELATEIVDAWATTHTTWDGIATHLHAAWRGGFMVNAAEILRHTYPGWTAQNTINCETYFLNVLYPEFRLPDPLRSANQGANNLWGAIQVAVFCNDQQKFQDCLEAYLNDPCGGISNSLPNGQCGDTGRDQGHAAAMIGNLGSVARIFGSQGIDVFEVLDNRLLKMMEYWCQYNLGGEVEYIAHGTCYGYYPSIGSAGRSSTYDDFISVMEGVHAAYVVRKGLQAPFTAAYLAGLNPTIDTFLYRRDSSFTGPTELSREPFAPFSHTELNSLTETEIGNTSTAGSSTFANGSWAVSGSGDELNGRDISYHFSYTTLSGDGEMVAQVQFLQNTDPDAAAAIVIRPSLNDSQGPSAAVSARPVDGSRFTARNFDAADGNGTQAFPLSNLLTGPVWLRLERRGNHIIGYVGPDGVTWAPMQHVIYDDWPEDVFIGLATTSANNNELTTAVFSDVQISLPLPTVVVDDSFDDGNLATNINGTGDGFNSFATTNINASVAEANGNVIFDLPINGGRRAAITSADGAAINTNATTRFEFNEINLPLNPANTGTGNTDRLYFGVSNVSTAGDTQNNPQAGFYIQVESDGIATGAGNTGFNGTSALFFEDVDNTRTILATWEFDGLDFAGGVTNSTALSFVFDITATSYSVSISGDTISNLTGSLSGDFTHGLNVGYATVFAQVEAPGINPEIGRIVITEAAVEIPTTILRGDVNLDGFVNFLDISPFIASLSSGIYQAESDCDENGFINFLDITPFITILSGQ